MKNLRLCSPFLKSAVDFNCRFSVIRKNAEKMKLDALNIKEAICSDGTKLTGSMLSSGGSTMWSSVTEIDFRRGNLKDTDFCNIINFCGANLKRLLKEFGSFEGEDLSKVRVRLANLEYISLQNLSMRFGSSITDG